MSSAVTARMKGLRVKAQTIPVAISIRSVLPGQVGGLGDRAAEQLRRPDALDARRLGLQRSPPRGPRPRCRSRRPRRGSSALRPAAARLADARRGSRRRRARGATWRRRTIAAFAGRALEEEVEVVLPGEADAAVDLDRGVGDAPAGVRGVGLRHRGGQRQRLGLGVGGPGGVERRRAGVLGLQQHLRAAVGDRLVGADRAAELLAVLGVLDRHLERPLGDAGLLGGERDADRGGRPGSSRRPAPGSVASAATRTPSKRTAERRRVGSIDGSRLTVTPSASRSTTWRRPSEVATRKKSAAAASMTRTFSPSRTTPSPSALASIVKSPDRCRRAGVEERRGAAQLALGERAQVALLLLVGAADRRARGRRSCWRRAATGRARSPSPRRGRRGRRSRAPGRPTPRAAPARSSRAPPSPSSRTRRSRCSDSASSRIRSRL